MNIIDEFINGATANHEDPHFKTTLMMFDDSGVLMMLDDSGSATAIKVTCTIGQVSATRMISREEIESIRIPASQFGSHIRHMLWEQVSRHAR